MSEEDSGVEEGSESNSTSNGSSNIDNQAPCDEFKMESIPGVSGCCKPFYFPQFCFNSQMNFGLNHYTFEAFGNYSPRMRPVKRHILRLKSPISRMQVAECKLRTAASLNEYDAVRQMLECGVNINCCDKRQRTPLHLAASKGHVETVKLLLERGADPNRRDIAGNTALHLTACTSHTEIITILLKAGTDPRALDNCGRTPLQLAKAKLKLVLQSSESSSSDQLKREILQIIELINVYLQKKGKTEGMDLLISFTNRLSLHQTKEEVDNDVQDLLDNISQLSI